MIYWKQNTLLLAGLVMGLVFVSCSESQDEEPDLSNQGYEFMPLEVGDEWVFDLDSIIYDPEPGGIVIDTLGFELRFVVADTFIDGNNEKVFQVDRYIKRDTTSAWKLTDVWSVKRTEDRVVWREGNLPFISMIFPMKEGSRWDGNALFDDDQVRYKVRGETIDVFKFWADYEVQSIQEEMIGGRLYDSVATILHVDREITIEKRFSQEKYAKGQGLVYKEMWILDTQNENSAIPFEERAQRGYIVRLTRK